MSDNAKQWRWVGEDGVEKTVTEQELIAELSSESLPNFTLVWRKGWAEWLPAMQVSELSWSLPPGRADQPAKARERAGAETPPAPPLYRYPVLKRRAQNLKKEPVASRPGPPGVDPPTEPLPQAIARGVVPATVPGVGIPRATPSPPRAGTVSGLGATPRPAGPGPIAAPRAPSKPPPPIAAPRAPSKPPPPIAPPQIAPPPIVPPPRMPSRPPIAAASKLPLPPPPTLGTSRPPPAPSRKAAPGGAVDDEEFEVADDDEDDDQTLEAPPVIEGPTFIEAKSEGSAPFIDAASDVDDDDEDLEEVSAVEHPIPLNVGLEKLADDDSDDAATRVLGRDLLGSSGPVYVAPHTPPPSEAPPASHQEVESFPPPPRAPTELGRYGDTGRGMLETLPQKLGRLPQALKALPQTVSKLPRRTQIGGGVGLVALVGLLGWAASGSDEESPASSDTSEAVVGSVSSATSKAAAAPAAAPEVDSCSLRSPAARLAEFADATVQPLLVRIPGSQRVAVGYAQAGDYAMGITVDPVTLDKDQVFRNYRAKNGVVTVAPVTAGDKLRFEVVRKNDKLSPAAIVNVDPPFRIGKGEEGLARAPLDRGATEIVYTIGEDDITAPKVATLGSTGHAVALRRGGTAGVVTVGTLTPTGGKLTDLQPVHSKAEFSGTPAVAAKDDSLLVAFAARNGTDGDWFLALSTVRGGDSPTSATPFTPPPGGPGQNLISPALAASDKGWVVQWTEGKSGNRVVRVQTLDRDLQPTGKALNLSPSEVNAGGGAIWVDGGDVISLFFVQKGKGHELWGAPLACSR